MSTAPSTAGPPSGTLTPREYAIFPNIAHPRFVPDVGHLTYLRQGRTNESVLTTVDTYKVLGAIALPPRQFRGVNLDNSVPPPAWLPLHQVALDGMQPIQYPLQT